MSLGDRPSWTPWLSLTQGVQRVTDEVLNALIHSHGALDAPPLTVAAGVLADHGALPTLQRYVERDLASGWGAASFVAAAIAHLGGMQHEVRLTETDRQEFAAMLTIANQLRESAWPSGATDSRPDVR